MHCLPVSLRCVHCSGSVTLLPAIKHNGSWHSLPPLPSCRVACLGVHIVFSSNEPSRLSVLEYDRCFRGTWCIGAFGWVAGWAVQSVVLAPRGMMQFVKHEASTVGVFLLPLG